VSFALDFFNWFVLVTYRHACVIVDQFYNDMSGVLDTLIMNTVTLKLIFNIW